MTMLLAAVAAFSVNVKDFGAGEVGNQLLQLPVCRQALIQKD